MNSAGRPWWVFGNPSGGGGVKWRLGEREGAPTASELDSVTAARASRKVSSSSACGAMALGHNVNVVSHGKVLVHTLGRASRHRDPSGIPWSQKCPCRLKLSAGRPVGAWGEVVAALPKQGGGRHLGIGLGTETSGSLGRRCPPVLASSQGLKIFVRRIGDRSVLTLCGGCVEEAPSLFVC